MGLSLTSVPGCLVGHADDPVARTGVTVVLLPEGSRASVDVRGGAPGTRETDLLDPSAMVQTVDAICLCGGSAFGLAAADGVMRWLRAAGRGFMTSAGRVPIVPAAVLFDLGVGAADVWPDAAMGMAACAAASAARVAEGQVGAGCGATVGKILGGGWASPGGVGSVARQLDDGTWVGALVVVNAFGNVYRDRSDHMLAGVRDAHGALVDERVALAQMAEQLRFVGGNTTLAVIVTDATLDKAGCRSLARMAQDGLARTIRPIHTPFDGDTVFAAATGSRSAVHGLLLGTLAADLLAEAVERAVQPA